VSPVCHDEAVWGLVAELPAERAGRLGHEARCRATDGLRAGQAGPEPVVPARDT
jgi:hypothetical protein